MKNEKLFGQREILFSIAKNMVGLFMQVLQTVFCHYQMN